MNQEELEQEANRQRVANIVGDLELAIAAMQQAKCITGLNSRSLSEAMTCAETALLWMRQVPRNNVLP